MHNKQQKSIIMEQNSNMDGDRGVSRTTTDGLGSETRHCAETGAESDHRSSKECQTSENEEVQDDVNGLPQQQSGQEELTLPAPVIKKPVFIASAESRIVAAVDNFLLKREAGLRLLDPDEYLLMVLPGEIYQKLHQQYLFTQLNEEQQKSEMQAQQAGQLKEAAIVQALQLEQRIRSHRQGVRGRAMGNWGDCPEKVLQFNEKELKVILSATQKFDKGKKKIAVTHQDVWNLMDFLLIQGYLQPVTMDENVVREKRVYQLVIEEEDQLKGLRRQQEEMLYKLQFYTEQNVSLEAQIVELQNKIDGAKSVARTDEAQRSDSGDNELQEVQS